MKKIFLCTAALTCLLWTACTNDAIEIEQDTRHDVTLNIATQQLYDDFTITESIKQQMLSSKNNQAVAIISLAYDEQGELADSATTYIKTFSQVHQTLNVKEGVITLITIETLVDPANDYQSDFWSIEGADKLSTLVISGDDAWWYGVVGVYGQKFTIGSDQQLNITPAPIGSVIDVTFYNIDKTDNDYAAFFTKNAPSGYRPNPSLPLSDRYTFDEYTAQRTWEARGWVKNQGGHLDAEEGFDVYLIDTGNLNWCVSATKIADDGSISFTAYPNRDSYYNFTNGGYYMAGLYYNGSTYNAFLGTRAEYSTWYSQQSYGLPPATTLYREPYTTWGGTVTDVKSYMSNYRLRSDIAYDSEYAAYVMNYYGSDEEAFVEYAFTTATGGLTDSYVYVDTSIDRSKIQAQLVAEGYRLHSYDSEDDYYLYTNGTTGILLYSGSAYHIVNYYDIAHYNSSVKAAAPRRFMR